jgi:hypothetical protein
MTLFNHCVPLVGGLVRQMTCQTVIRLPVFPDQLANKICRYCHRPFDPNGDRPTFFPASTTKPPQQLVCCS